MKIKMKHCLTFIFFMYLSIFKICALEPEYCQDVRKFNVSWKNGLNNNIRVIDCNGEVKYFKECKKKLHKKEDEVKRIIVDYFDDYLDGSFSCDKQLLMETIFKDSNLDKFINAGFLWNRNSNLSKYMAGKIDIDNLGINNDIAEKLKINIKDFLLYSSRELVQRCISSDIEEGNLQTNLAVKQIATYRLSKLLGVDNLVVKSNFVKLITKRGEIFGVFTEQAQGVSVDEVENINLVVDPKFQKDLVALQILDTITNEQDHNPGNCFFKVEEGRLIGVEAFDNEGGFGTNTNMQKGLCWNTTSPVLTKDNKINLPHISRVLAKKILDTKDDDIEENLKDLISDSQIDSCIKRFNCLKNALNNTLLENENFLLEGEEWSSNTVSKEISGKYGNTYLTHFLKKLNISI